jgi:hypothetical protein
VDYIERKAVIATALAERKIEDPNPFADLWQWYGKWSADLPNWQSRRSFITEMLDPIVARIREEMQGEEQRAFDEPTGWARVDRTVGEIKRRLSEARTEEQFQAVGLLCREALVSVAQVVYDPELHPTLDGVAASATDVKRMLEAYLSAELGGDANEASRKHAKAALDLANELTHKRTATHRFAALAAESSISVINILAIVSGQRDPQTA